MTKAQGMLVLADKIGAFDITKTGPIALIARERRMIEDALRLAAQAEAPDGVPQSPRQWDEGEHEGCGIDSQRAFDKFMVIEQCAKIAENCFSGKAHTYSSENADLYRAQDAACELIAAKIRSLSVTRPLRHSGDK